MEWIALTEALMLADFPSELKPLYDTWLADNPDKAGRLAAIIANTAAEIRALIASNPANTLDEDETKIPLSLLRQAETLIYFTLSMEMGVSIAPEANQAMIRAEITLRTLVYGRYLVSGGSSEDLPSPLYNPEPEPPAARTLPALAAVLALFLGVTAAPAAWVKPPNAGTQLTEVDPFWTAFRAGELVTIGNNAVGSGDAVAIGTWANSDAGGFAIGSHADGSTFGSVLGFYSVGSLYGAAFGYQADGHDHGVAIGYNATGHTYGVALGYQAAADNYSVAIGADARSVYGLAAGFRASAEGQATALGWYADAKSSGTAIGYTSRASTNGTAIGADASVSDLGVAVGMGAGGGRYGAALGSGANGSDSGVAVGYDALGSSSNIAIGYRARADVPETLIYGCNTCTSPSAEFPSPTGYMTGYPTNRISIGPDTFNLVDHSALIRGSLYLDGAMAIHYRATFGTGEWAQAFPVASEASEAWQIALSPSSSGGGGGLYVQRAGAGVAVLFGVTNNSIVGIPGWDMLAFVGSDVSSAPAVLYDMRPQPSPFIDRTNCIFEYRAVSPSSWSNAAPYVWWMESVAFDPLTSSLTTTKLFTITHDYTVGEVTNQAGVVIGPSCYYTNGGPFSPFTYGGISNRPATGRWGLLWRYRWVP
ncbi:MAG: hypothetical protein KBC05_10565 [Candidatus Hydrogenedentes bacterium]|nr:hypothetical protein [Candidatus Hydrogenedentota bacterium]